MSSGEVFARLGGRSPAAQAAIEVASRAASSDIPILIEGESGVGKEVLARAVHDASPRRAAPFVAVNCGALPEGLVESILFGHARGAFTGAVEARDGKFVEADGGTLFLDEVGELAPDAQAKLLRALQEREVDPVGAARARKVDIRVISATNRVLEQDAARGRFRKDLYYRLAVLSLRMPPLRERRADIAVIAETILARLARRMGGVVRSLSPAALHVIESAPWPGNIRELENALHRAAVLAEGPVLGPELFSGRGEAVAGEGGDAGADAHPALTPDGHVISMTELEALHIRYALERYDGRIAEAARRLGVGRSTLYRKLEEMEDRKLEALGREKDDAAVSAPVDRRVARS